MSIRDLSRGQAYCALNGLIEMLQEFIQRVYDVGLGKTSRLRALELIETCETILSVFPSMVEQKDELLLLIEGVKKAHTEADTLGYVKTFIDVLSTSLESISLPLEFTTPEQARCLANQCLVEAREQQALKKVEQEKIEKGVLDEACRVARGVMIENFDRVFRENKRDLRGQFRFLGDAQRRPVLVQLIKGALRGEKASGSMSIDDHTYSIGTLFFGLKERLMDKGFFVAGDGLTRRLPQPPPGVSAASRRLQK